MTMLKCSVALAALVLAAMPAEAGGRDLYYTAYNDYRTNAPGIERRIIRQRKRIRRGFRNGHIGPHAKDRLRAYLRRIKQELHYAREDHRVTRHERRHLHRLLNENSRRIASFRFRDHHRYDRGGRYSYKDVPPTHKSYKDDYREPEYGSYKDDDLGGYDDKYEDGYRGDYGESSKDGVRDYGSKDLRY